MASTVGAGSLCHPNGMKPYYYNGYYYVFYLNTSTNKICYRKSSDGENWGSEVEICSFYSQAQAMAIDNKILLTYLVSSSGYVNVRVGTIQADGTISWDSAKTIGASTSNRAISNYVVKINGSRRFFSKAGPTDRDRLYRSTDDGSTWTNLDFCTEHLGYYAFQVVFIPYENSTNPDRVETIYSKAYNPTLKTRERNGSSCGGENDLGGFRNEHYLYGQAYGILIDNEVHVIFIDNSNNLLHKKATYAGSWTTVGTVKSGITNDAGLTLSYDESSSKLYIFYWEDTSIKYKTWSSEEGYSSEKTLVTGEADINYLTAYPKALNSEIILVWYDGTNVRFHKLGTITALEKSLEEIFSITSLISFKKVIKALQESSQFKDLNPKLLPKSFLEALSFSDSSCWNWLFFGSEFLTILESKSFYFKKTLQKLLYLADKEISKKSFLEILSISPTIKNLYKLKEFPESLFFKVLLAKTLKKRFSESILLQEVFEKLQRLWEQISLSYSFSRHKIPIFFSTGFETGDLSRWDYTIEKNGKIPEVVTDFTHHGTYSLKIARGWGCVHKIIDLNPIWVKCFYRYTGNQDLAAIGPCISVDQTKEFDVKHPVYLAIGGEGFDESLRIYAHILNGIQTAKVMVGEFTKDTWHSIVLGAYRHPSQGWYKVYVDGELVYSKENINNVNWLNYPWAIGGGATGAYVNTFETNWTDCFAVSNQYLSPGAADPPPPELSVFQSLLFYSKIALSPRPLILTSLKLLSKILPFYFKKVLKEEEKELIFEVNG